MRYEILVEIVVDVEDDDAVRAAAFAILNNAPGEEDFAAQSTQTIEASLSALIIQSGDLRVAVEALSAKTPGLRFSSIGAGSGDVKRVVPRRRGGPEAH